jgi:UDP-N-acetyl-D-mannosaminuronic acid transferase (WecB/TagA/CpsF family)
LAVLGIHGAADAACAGGLVLAPSGPGLCGLGDDPDYRRALESADINLADSGLAIILARVLGMGALQRTSGLGFLEALLERSEVKAPGATFWVMPSVRSMERNLAWLRSKGLGVSEGDCHVAPVYPKEGPVLDWDLLGRLRGRAARFVFVCTGSGTQEKLGLWLKENLPGNPAICCIGAAIGFLSGDQVRIPKWADRLCLGWLLRCLSAPGKFVPRYASATRLAWLAARYRGVAPPMRAVR